MSLCCVFEQWGRFCRLALIVMILGLIPMESMAELLNVEVGGEIRIRGRYFRNNWAETLTTPGELRIPDQFLEQRPIGPWGARSRFSWERRGADSDYFEQSARLNVSAHFSEDLMAFIELKSYDVWGDQFRTDWISGEDYPPVGERRLNVFEAYIQNENFLGQPLRLRIGRQALEHGKGFLVSSRYGIIDRSWDTLRLTYEGDSFDIDGWIAMLHDSGMAEQDGDVTMQLLEGRYHAWDPLDIALYWLWIRDPRAISDTNLIFLAEWFEDLFGVDDYDTTHLHTLGLRAHGETGPLDYDLELAIQRGYAGGVGHRFQTDVYGDNRARFDNNWAMDVEVGYTFEETPWQPRVALGGAYYSGEDNRNLSFADWLNPFHRPEASVSFNRVYSFFSYSLLMDLTKEMSNFHQIRTRVRAQPTDQITANWELAYFGVNETFDWPRNVRVGRYRVPIAPNLPFWTQSSSSRLGVVSHLLLSYQYSEDWNINAGWERLFIGDGLRDGNFTHRNGLEYSGGSGHANAADLFYLDTRISF